MTEIDRRQQILEGALHVFSTMGYHKASIKKIAKAAGIKSSALIYHYFEDKKALLNAVMKELSPARDMPFLDATSHEQLLRMPPEVVLSNLARIMLSLKQDEEIASLMRLFISEAVRMPDIADTLVETQTMALQFLIRYFKYQQEQGSLIVHNAEVSARAFIGTILINIFAKLIFPPIAKDFPDDEIYIQESVNIFLSGLKDTT